MNNLHRKLYSNDSFKSEKTQTPTLADRKRVRGETLTERQNAPSNGYIA